MKVNINKHEIWHVIIISFSDCAMSKKIFNTLLVLLMIIIKFMYVFRNKNRLLIDVCESECITNYALGLTG